MPINHWNIGTHESPVTSHLPWQVMQIRKQFEATISPMVRKWAAEQAQRIARGRQSRAWEEIRLHTEIRTRFLPFTRAQRLDVSVFEPIVVLEVMCNLYEEALAAVNNASQSPNATLQHLRQLQQGAAQATGLSSQMRMGDDSQLANVDLQNRLQKQQQTLQMLSNISKILYDTSMSVIRKIGG